MDGEEAVDLDLLRELVASKDGQIASLCETVRDLQQQIANLTNTVDRLNKANSDDGSAGSSTAGNRKTKLRRLDGVASSFGKLNTIPIDVSAESTMYLKQNISCNTNASNNKMDESHVSSQTVNDINLNDRTFAQIAAAGAANIKPMPFQLGELNRASVNDILGALSAEFCGGFEFIQLKSGSSPKIYPKNIEMKHKISAFLSSKGIEYNTFSEKGQKRQSFIVRGLNYGDEKLNIEHIRHALRDVGVTGDIQIARYLTGFMKRNHNVDQTILYRFTLEFNSKTVNIPQIKIINGFRVIIEKMRKSAVVQCRRCQRFQHTANSCSFQYRCVQCVTSHVPGQCPRSTDKKLSIQCCNCTAAGFENKNHTANNLNACPFFKTKHSFLFNKFQKSDGTRATNSSAKTAAISSVQTIATTSSTFHPNVNSDELLGPARANGQRKSKQRANAAIQHFRPGAGAEVNVNSKNSRNLNRSTTNVNSGESHTVSAFSDDKINALTCALVQVLRQFL